MYFIQLTSPVNGEPLWVNPEKIAVIQPSSDSNCTVFAEGGIRYQVKENAKTVMRLCERREPAPGRRRKSVSEIADVEQTECPDDEALEEEVPGDE